MVSQRSLFSMILILAFLPAVVAGQESEQDKPKSDGAEKQSVAKQKISVADGYLSFEAPASWKKNQSKFDFIHGDFNIPRAEGDSQDGRITFSQVGGSVDENIKRWFSQFKGIDVADKEHVMRKTEKVDGKEVQLVRISGTFLDSAGGPLGPQTERENYVLYGAVIGTDGDNVYIKAYGPKKTMESSHKSLEEMLESMKVSNG